MKKQSIITSLVLCCLAVHALEAQMDTIRLKNPSFEDMPSHSRGVRGWTNCGFRGESPPDVQPFQARGAQWGQRLAATDGRTYLGLVVRDNDTYERVGQQLDMSLKADRCYRFTIFLSTSANYYSASKVTDQLTNYVEPAVFKIFGGSQVCGRHELLAVSDLVTNNEWDQYEFTFRPASDHDFILLEAHHRTPTLFTYNGNILVDHASPIIEITCPEDVDLIAEDDVIDPDSKERPIVATKPIQKPKTQPSSDTRVEVATAVEQRRPVIPEPDTRILSELSRSSLKQGKAVRIDQLYFEADTATLNAQSTPVLEEVAYFLSINHDIRVEIGGHTNNIPPDHFCDSLSTHRARSVAEYLYDRGIPQEQVSYQGYGKRQPIATNQTKWGRQRNQRVEIKLHSSAQ